jgi:hypothetical protein
MRLREAHKNWLRRISERRGQSLTALARAIDVEQSVLTRFMNDDERGSTLDTLTIAALVELSGEQPPADVLGGGGQPARLAFREEEAEPYHADASGRLKHIVAVMTGDAPHLAPFILKSLCLQEEGFLPGDLLLVDLNALPQSGDRVCAQIYDWSNPANTRTVFRVFEPPFLLYAGPEKSERKPRLVDGENVTIKGVIKSMYRPSV